MFVSSIVVTASLVGTLVLFFAAAAALAYVDHLQDKHRAH